MAVFYNQANLTYSGGSTNSNIVTGEIIEVISVNKTAVDPSYGAGDTATYVVNIINSGNTVMGGITLTDDLGAYNVGNVNVVPLTYIDGTVNYYRNGVPQPTPTVTAGPPLTITGISVPAGGNVTVVYSARVNEGAPLAEGSTIVNTVTLTGEGITTPVTAAATINADAEPVLTISKGINPTTVTDNSTITYTFTVRNLGNREATAADNIVITDTFDPILSDIVVTVNGDTVAEGETFTYNEATGLFTTTAGVLTVPAAQYAQDPTTGEWTVTPGTTVITVVGTI